MSAKESAQSILNQLPDKASWDEILYELHVRQKIEAGLHDVEKGRTTPHDQIKSRIMTYDKRTT